MRAPMDARPNFPDGVIDGDRHLYAVRAYYEDTDLSGIVYHANYLRWFERARSDLLRRLEINQRAAIEEGGGAYADDIIIETRCTELKAASCRMHQTASRGDELLAEARLRVGFVSPGGRPIRQPAPWREAFAHFVDTTED